MKNTTIEWADHTFNPWIGCTKISPACENCYAEKSMPAKFQGVAWGAGNRRNRTSETYWQQPRKWNAEADRLGVRYRVFCASLADVFDNDVPVEWRADLIDLIAATPHLDWLLLTKRIGNAHQMLSNACHHAAGWTAFPNVWIGATICNQAEADRDIPKLLAVPAAKRFLSMEPLLGAVSLFSDMTGELLHTSRNEYDPGSIDWVIVGGESGPGARPMHPDWVLSLRDQCAAAYVPFFFKQWGNWRAAIFFDGPDADKDAGDDFIDLDRTPHQFLASDGRTWDTNGGQYMYPPAPLKHWCLMVNEGKKITGRSLDGREYNEVPS